MEIVTDQRAAEESSGPQIKNTGTSRSSYRATVEEVEDEFWEADVKTPKAKRYVIESGSENEDHSAEEQLPLVEEEEVDLPPPPKVSEPIVMRRKRNPKPGESAVGVSVLSVKGWIGSTENEPIDLRIDSCADITLLLEEYYAAMPNPPVIREGHRMSLAELTNEGTAIKGYAKLKVMMESTEGEILQLEAEAYVVKGMSVPILLGEDFQINYEMGVSRNENGSKLTFGGTEHEVKAAGVDSYAGRKQLHSLATGLTAHAGRLECAKVHRRDKKGRQRRRHSYGVENRIVRANDDYRIMPHSTRVIRLTGNFKEDKTWMVESNFLANADDSFSAYQRH